MHKSIIGRGLETGIILFHIEEEIEVDVEDERS